MLAKHQDTIAQEVSEYLTKITIPPQGGRGENEGINGNGNYTTAVASR